MQFLAVGEGFQAGRGIVAVQPEVQREVVAGPGADHQEGQVVLGCDSRDQCLGSVAAGDAEEVGAISGGLPG